MMSGTSPLAPTRINLLYRGIHQGANVLHFPANIVPDAYCLILQDMVFAYGIVCFTKLRLGLLFGFDPAPRCCEFSI